YRIEDQSVVIDAPTEVRVAGLYVVTRDQSLRQRLAEKTTALDQREKELGFDPIGNPEDRKRLERWVD
ncbi:MAG: hypothetical protein LW720_20360, partial [Pirellula sp.]|nr:hypothetical protein [Pirellula sp.]